MPVKTERIFPLPQVTPVLLSLIAQTPITEQWYLNPAKPAGAPIQLQVSGQFLPPRYWDDGTVGTIHEVLGGGPLA